LRKAGPSVSNDIAADLAEFCKGIVIRGGCRSSGDEPSPFLNRSVQFGWKILAAAIEVWQRL